MKSKILGIFVCMLLMLSMFPMLGTAEYEVKTVNYNGNGEVLDQQQTITYGLVGILCSDSWIAQGFKPTVTTLTRVEIYLYKYLSPPTDAIISVFIRETLNGTNLTSIDVEAGDYFPKWLEFDFPDIQVVPEQTYYIIARGEYCNSSTGASYGWTAIWDNPYERGEEWIWDPYQGWELVDYEDYPECDATFKTYGLNEAPETPSIDGPADGKVGIEYDFNISTTDYEGYDIWYYIEWGDGQTEEWIGPFASGENVTVSHTWNIKKDYEVRVKAKDIHDSESDWATLEISIPKSRVMNWWMSFLEKFPILHKMIIDLFRFYTS
jgi:hypothetical protein